MAKEFLTDDGHVMGFSDTSWLRDEGLQEQLNDDSYAIDNIGTYPLDDASYLPKNDCFYSDLPFSLKDTVPSGLMTAADKNITLFGPLEVPLSMPSSLNPSLVSNSYDNRDFDVTEPSIRGQSSMILVDGEFSKSNALKHRHRLGLLTSSPVPDLNGRLRMVSTDQHNSVTEFQGPVIAQKRKRAFGNVACDEINNSLIDRESALMLCIKHIPDPTIGVIDSIAQDFGFPFEFVMDLCCRYRKNRNSDPRGLDNVETAQHSASIYGLSDELTLPNGKCPASTTGIDDLALTTVAAKRSKLYTEAIQAAENDPQIKSHRCPNCAQTFSRHPDLIRHRRTHFPPQIHCPYPGCNKSFTRKDKLNEHWRRRHSGDTSQSDITRRSQDEWGKDPDSGGSKGADNFFGGNGNGRGGSSFQNSQNAAISASQGWSSYGASSGASFSFAADVVEVHPVPTNQAIDDYLKKFTTAKVMQKLGRGSFGSVYKISISTGSDAKQCEIFACKTISIPKRGCEEVIERARNEISILQLLDHPQIIKFSGAFILRDRIFINSQPLADSNLKVFLAEQSPPIPSLIKKNIWEGLRGLASALAYLHSYGKGNGFHGDLKPENILVLRETEPRPRIKFLMADFGTAWISTSHKRVAPKTQAVTPKYCAPECSTNKSAIGPLSDVWSLACIMVEIVTYIHDKTLHCFEGFLPHNTDPDSEWTYNERWTYSESLPAVNDWLRYLSLNCSQPAYPIIQCAHMNLIKGMLLPDPGDRPSAAEVVNRLEIMESVTVDAVDRQGIQPLLLAQKPEQPSRTRSRQGFNKCGETASKASERKECREFSPQLPSEMVSARKIDACKECWSHKVKCSHVLQAIDSHPKFAHKPDSLPELSLLELEIGSPKALQTVMPLGDKFDAAGETEYISTCHHKDAEHDTLTSSHSRKQDSIATSKIINKAFVKTVKQRISAVNIATSRLMMPFSCATEYNMSSHSSLPQILASAFGQSYFCDSSPVTTQASQDTWTSTNARNNDIVAQHRNESAPAYKVSSPISLESAETDREQRQIEAGRVRAATAVEEFDILFNNTLKTPKPSKKSETRKAKSKKSEERNSMTA